MKGSAGEGTKRRGSRGRKGGREGAEGSWRAERSDGRDSSQGHGEARRTRGWGAPSRLCFDARAPRNARFRGAGCCRRGGPLPARETPAWLPCPVFIVHVSPRGRGVSPAGWHGDALGLLLSRALLRPEGQGKKGAGKWGPGRTEIGALRLLPMGFRASPGSNTL